MVESLKPSARSAKKLTGKALGRRGEYGVLFSPKVEDEPISDPTGQIQLEGC